jgi:allantoin racemase
MHIQLVNPNSSASMTMLIRESAKACAFAGTRITAVNPDTTPSSIEGYTDEAMSVPAMLELIRKGEAQGVNAHVIACFDDPGLAAAREIASGPVIGICQAAIQVATCIATRFSVVTSLSRSVPIIEDLVQAYGSGSRCRSVRCVDMPVLALEAEPEIAENRLIQEIEAARDQDRVDAVILGCAGMADLCRRLEERTGMPVIDGVAAAVKIAEGLVGGQYRTSKLGGYNYPETKAERLV